MAARTPGHMLVKKERFCEGYHGCITPLYYIIIFVILFPFLFTDLLIFWPCQQDDRTIFPFADFGAKDLKFLSTGYSSLALLSAFLIRAKRCPGETYYAWLQCVRGTRAAMCTALIDGQEQELLPYKLFFHANSAGKQKSIVTLSCD